MRDHILVCPSNDGLLSRLHHKQLVVVTESFESIQHIRQLVNDHQNNLQGICIHHASSLAAVPFHESWRGVPLAIYATEMGPFKEIMGKLQLLRDLNLRIFLNSDYKVNFTNLHILSSLGIHCGLSFGEKDIDWDAMNDLMTYSIYGKVYHASIEPFIYTAGNYNPARLTDYSSVYFDDPHKYLHLDAEENIALSAQDLKDGNFISKGLDSLPYITGKEKFDEVIYYWQKYFLKSDGCAYCQGWRVCLGKFSESAVRNPGCKQFFAEMMDASDHFLSVQNKNKRKELWQP